jgi:hypothetical protein
MMLPSRSRGSEAEARRAKMLTKDEARRIAVNKAGLGHLALLDLASGSLQPIQTEFTEFGSVSASGNRVVFRGAASVRPTSTVPVSYHSRGPLSLRSE